LISAKTFKILIDKLANTCENKLIRLLNNIDKNILLELYRLFTSNNTIFNHINDNIIQIIKAVIDSKTKCDEMILLNPTLGDLFKCNVYKFRRNEQNFIVPLWHHELIDDSSGADLYIRCNPVLDDKHFIDNDNNLHIKVELTINEIWKKKTFHISVDSKVFECNVDRVKLIEYQVIILKKQGLPQIIADDIYNIDKKKDVFLHLYLTL